MHTNTFAARMGRWSARHRKTASPFVVAWFDDPALGHALVDATVQFNDGLEAIYTAAGSPVADVETAFSTTDFPIQPDGLPLNVQRICRWTLMCALGDPHPNQEGLGRDRARVRGRAGRPLIASVSDGKTAASSVAARSATPRLGR